MATILTKRTRSFRIISQDPEVCDVNNQMLTTTVDIPVECLYSGPWGHRVQVVDFDSYSSKFYDPLIYEQDDAGFVLDPFIDKDAGTLIEDRHFHSQNVYAIVMRTLMLFERALGRRVNWGGKSHQLKLVPTAFYDANAFYWPQKEAILFGYFPATNRDGNVYTCLSHDVIVHETTHALLDGLRSRFVYPSSPDQAAFHEGFSDIVALLSVFSLSGVVEAVLKRQARTKKLKFNWISKNGISPQKLKQSALLGLAEQMGQEGVQAVRGTALRRSVDLDPNPDYYNNDPQFIPAHRRGEILVAATMNTFIHIWSERLKQMSSVSSNLLDLDRVVEEGKDIADYFLSTVIRAIDYTPPVHLEFCDYLSAMITADKEIHPNDTRYQIRKHLLSSFESYGIKPAVGAPVASRDPASQGSKTIDGAWLSVDELDLSYDQIHFEAMTRDPDEVFKFIWDNRQVLHLDGGLSDQAYCNVLSVRPCVRISIDGFALRETVAEFYQVVRLGADELKKLGYALPADMPDEIEIPLYGGGTLIFNEYGRLKYYIHNSLDNRERQEKRIKDLWSVGALPERADRRSNFARLHRLRAMDAGDDPREEW